MAPSPNKASKCRGRIATAPLAMASMMRVPERLDPPAVVEVDEEIDRAKKRAGGIALKARTSQLGG